MSGTWGCEFCSEDFQDWPALDKHECPNDPDYLRGIMFERNRWGKQSEDILAAIARERDGYSWFNYMSESYSAVQNVYDRVEELLNEMFVSIGKP